MPARRAPYRRRMPRRSKRTTKPRSKKPMQATNRRPAIQRATYTPQSKMVEFVRDETFVLRGNALDKDSNSMGLRVQLLNPEQGMAWSVTQANPYWGAFDPASSHQSLEDLTAPPPGWGRWLSPTSSTALGEAPYRRGMVVGGSYECRSELLARTDNVDSTNMVRALAVCSYITPQGPSEAQSGLADISDVQNFRNTKRNNITVPAGMGGNTGTSSVGQQVTQTGTFSTKRQFGVTDLRDGQDRFSGIYSGAGDTWTKPEEFLQLTVGYYDRCKTLDAALEDHYVMPDILVRLKVKYTVLLTTPNVQFNTQL